ncbi:YggS family pyridoxal phosphate-dependent enzyme [Paenibacillus sp. J5C_2022]|uniref:YggS family pyridoxal phosphate-dependent enzyme n=1 Tax=Paenibacillus sp. J5C2022 TaxID=2977129 RepID=UPI0021D0B1B5|nr:YggS family pyridoxal phosphate-dependent enzyme [Paenibacillus sp. J5C2022]MCU6709457.1 YggS family pyridoxal phosphate-dependent enzyme [Paenibacillus sp. J5C2022]
MNLQERMQAVEERIAAAAERSGRQREDISVIAVTKYVSLAAAEEALLLGLEHLGENRWQHAEQKWRALSGDEERQGKKPVWHFIGSLQTNKVKEVVGRFRYIHSLDRLSLAEAIHKQASRLGIVVPCFIQVNVSGESSKHGMNPEDVHEFIQCLGDYPAVKPIGLMTMAPFESEPEQTREVFRSLRRLRDEIAVRHGEGCGIRHLSMGMSNDFEIAIEEGATWIRLGTILMGKEEE